MKAELRRLLRYDVWGNAETLRALGENPPPKSLTWMAHPGRDCSDGPEELSGGWVEYLKDEQRRRLSQNVSYTHSKGEAWTNTAEGILIHITIHAAYHRGQIASDMRSAGQELAYTDYIHAVRQGLIE